MNRLCAGKYEQEVVKRTGRWLGRLPGRAIVDTGVCSGRMQFAKEVQLGADLQCVGEVSVICGSMICCEAVVRKRANVTW